METGFGIMVAMDYDKENIKTFVTQILGCACPEKVFSYIDCKSDVQLNENVVLKSKINVGNRLLIYIVEVNNRDSVKDIMLSLVTMGKKERDNLRFNRFRLVLATDNLDEIKQVADSIFKTIDRDERVHLHIVSKVAIKIFKT